MTYTTTGRIADEYLVLQLPTGERREELVALVEKGAVSITIDKPHRPRTTGFGSQNHHLNGHIIQICNETGNDYDTVKSEIKKNDPVIIYAYAENEDRNEKYTKKYCSSK